MLVAVFGLKGNKMETQKKQYFEYLDALRCLAFLAVFYAHSGTIFLGATLADTFPLGILKRYTIYGSYGVNFFFVLSGFLITFLLLKEKSVRGKISIKKFYVKRILRIWPVYFITLLFGALILPFLIPSSTYSVLWMTNPVMSLRTITYFFFFLGNFYQGLGLGIGSLSIGILWSVCVEEQFYLVWPWAIRWLDTRKLTLFTIFLISLSLLYKFVWAEDRLANYYLPWSVGMDLAFGALLGIFYFAKKQRQIIVGAISTFFASILVIIAVLGIVYIQTYRLGTIVQHDLIKSTLIEILRLLKTPLIDCVFMLILLFYIKETAAISANNRHPVMAFFHLTKKKIGNALIYLGKISYGLYAYHTTCLMLVVHILYSSGFLTLNVSQTMFLVVVVCAMALTIFIAHTSSKLIEKRFLALKDIFD